MRLFLTRSILCAALIGLILVNKSKAQSPATGCLISDNRVYYSVWGGAGIRPDYWYDTAVYNTLPANTCKRTAHQLFKIVDLNVSLLSLKLKISNNNISRAIRSKGFSNFNAYINNHRINHAKKILQECDLTKFSLLYIYTESGFSSQATFNRAFKQIEELTPSEYIRKIKICFPKATDDVS